MNGKAINFIVSIWARTRSPASFPTFKRLDNLDEQQFESGPEFNFLVAFSLALQLSDLKVPFVSRRKEVITYLHYLSDHV